MTRLILIPAAQTDWRAQGRLAGDTDLPLNEYGHRQAVVFGEEIAWLQPAVVHCGPEKATKQTASIIAHELKLKLRPSKELRELDLGHWEGLTQEEFGERFARVHRQWRSAPLSIEPPEGEAVAHADERLHRTVERIIKKHPEETLALVLGPFAHALTRCQYVDHGYDRFWEYVDSEPQWCVVEPQDRSPPPPDPDLDGPPPPDLPEGEN
jgi:broad specificity phosphatase PhoE